jgi:hypothetical protein
MGVTAWNFRNRVVKNVRLWQPGRERLIIDAMTRGDRFLRAVLLVLATEVVALGIAMLPDPRQGSSTRRRRSNYPQGIRRR